MKKRIPVPNKHRALLQQEINSACPFCGLEDVTCFQIHHIDADPSNNHLENLVMLCANCHVKIEKSEISFLEVTKVKQGLAGRGAQVEVASVVLDSSACAWTIHREHEHAFFQTNENKPLHPVIVFTLTNHTSRTVVFRRIEATVKTLYSGLSGLGAEPQVLQPIASYHMALQRDGGMTALPLLNPIEVPAGRAFSFHLSISYEEVQGNIFPVEGRSVVYFVFRFDRGLAVSAPALCFNCTHENEPLRIQLLS